MNRSNPFRFDLRNGIRFIAKKFLVLPLLVSLVCFEFMLRLRETASLNHQYAGAQPTLGDFAMYLFGGMKPYIPNPDEPFLFPVSWFLVFGICLFLTLYYPVYDRDTFGKMVIVYSGSRTKWWTAKCAWIIVATFLYSLLKFPRSSNIFLNLAFNVLGVCEKYFFHGAHFIIRFHSRHRYGDNKTYWLIISS